jgi:methenyltetrahydromethanopterin cyclohydrolase
MSMMLNQRAASCCQELDHQSEVLRVSRHRLPNGATCWDLGVDAIGGLQAGLMMARVCLADLGTVALTQDELAVWQGPAITVHTDRPVSACMASQYAGWKISHEAYFAMGSGPMRAAAGQEELIDRIGGGETASQVVGVLEASQLPPVAVADQIAKRCGVEPDQVCLLVAKTSSQAGTVQVVARSVETALHKLDDLKFDLHQVVSGFGIAPLPPVAADDLTGIGRTNDAVLYGARVTLWVKSDDRTLSELVERVPSCASRDFGEPFRTVFARANHDFYQIDPHLFSPAFVRLVNLETGRTFQAGSTYPEILRASFLE